MNHFDFFRHDLNLLVAFDALVAERNVSRAAARVGITQSAMSHKLARLRRMFGDELFLRHPGGVAPTVVAEQLAPRIARALQDIHGVLSEGEGFDAATARRVFRIALSDGQQTDLLPPLLERVAQRAPGVTLQALAFDRRRVLEQLVRGEVDLAVSRFDHVDAPHVTMDLFEERHLCIWNPARVTIREPLTLDDYLAHPHVLLSHAGDLAGVVDQQLALLGRQRQIMATTPHAHTLALLVERTAALGVLPGRIARRCARWLGLGAGPVPLALGPFVVRALWHPRADTDRGNVWLRGLLREVAADRDDVAVDRHRSSA